MRCYLIALLLSIASSLSADDAAKNVVVLPAAEVVKGDFFALGNSVEISGTVLGDVYVLAQQVFIDGHVLGDVIGAGGSIEVAGQIDGNVRLFAGQILVTGNVGRSSTFLAGNLAAVHGSSIQGSVVCVAGNVDLSAKVGSDATIIASNLRIAGDLGRNVDAYIGQLRITSRASIRGDVRYNSDTEASIEPGAYIQGKVIQNKTVLHEILRGGWVQGILLGSHLAGILMNFIYTFVIGCILLRLLPKNVERALEALSRHPWKALSFGIAIAILLPLAALILLMTVLGAPFALTLLALNVITFYSAKVFSILWGANHLCSYVKLKKNTLFVFALGLLLYFALTAIPFAGPLIALAALLFGLGATLLSRVRV